MLTIRVNQNIELRQFQKKDAKILFEFININRDYLKKWLNWVNFIQSVEQEKKYLDSLLQDINKAPSIDFSIWYDKKLVGTLGLVNIDRLNRCANLGYCIDEAFQSKGIITESCNAIIEKAFKEFNIHRLEIRTAADNFRSKAVARRLGFRSEGTLRECYYINNGFIDCEVFGKIKVETKASFTIR